MFVSFYAFYYGLFSLRAISSADLPFLGEDLCQKHFCCGCGVILYAVWVGQYLSGAALFSKPVGCAAAGSLFTFSEQLSGTVLCD